MSTDTHSRPEPRADKVDVVGEIAEQFTNSSVAVITEYRGLTVQQISTLRRALGQQTTYAVVKNTLAKRAAESAGVAIDTSLLTGPTAIAFVGGDPVDAAKGLREFAKENPLLVIKGGYMDGKSLSSAEITKIADLEPREVLLAKVAGAIKALPARAAGLFQAPLAGAAQLIKALEDKGGAAPAAAAAVTAEPVTAEPVAAEAEAPADAAEAPAAEAEAAADSAPVDAETPADEAPAEPAE